MCLALRVQLVNGNALRLPAVLQSVNVSVHWRTVPGGILLHENRVGERLVVARSTGKKAPTP